MFEYQITTDGDLPKDSVTSAWGADAETDSVDMTVLLSFAELQQDNEVDLVGELIDLYLHDAPLQIAAIQNAVASADPRSLQHAAHSLRGSSGTLGVLQLASVCEELEYLTNDEPGITAALHRLEVEFVRVQEALISELHRRCSSA